MPKVTDDIGKAMFDILQSYCGDVEKVVRKTVKDVSREASERLRSTSPRKTGEYAKGWKVKQTRDAPNYAEATVYESKKPGLAHLLEHGRKAGKKNGYPYPAAPAKPHIQKIEEWAAEEVVKRLESKL